MSETTPDADAESPRRDWLDRLRGALPPMVPPRPTTVPFLRSRLLNLYLFCVFQGIIVGAAAGGISGGVVTTPLLFVGAPFGVVIGIVVGSGCGLVMAIPVTVLAGRKHVPLARPDHFHRELWVLLLLSIEFLDIFAVWWIARSVSAKWAWLLVPLNLIVVLLLRPAARRIVTHHARLSGWYVLVILRPAAKESRKSRA